jgi:hypothetical protein
MVDREWEAGQIRGPLHGIPVLLKDNIASPSLCMPTSAGSLALLTSQSCHDAARDPEVETQMDAELLEAYEVISKPCAHFVSNADLPSVDASVPDGKDAFAIVNNADYRHDFEEYLRNLDYSEVRSIQDLIQFNEGNVEPELPSHHDNQDIMMEIVNYPVQVNDVK